MFKNPHLKKGRKRIWRIVFLIFLITLPLSAIQNITTAPGDAFRDLTLAVLLGVPALLIHRRMRQYFNGEDFISQRNKISALIREHNDISAYAADLSHSHISYLGYSHTGAYSSYATYENTSRWNYKRDRNIPNLLAPNVHNCSLQTVNRARMDPLKYIMKHFNIPATEEMMQRVEALGSHISRVETAAYNLYHRELSITQAINPPWIIRAFYSDEFWRRMGVTLMPIQISYPAYTFEYVSAGGNSSQRSTTVLSPNMLDALIERMSMEVRFRKSAAGQRALMTARLRSYIKERDGFTCQLCNLSTHIEPNLLLEVDHIVPLSRGGLTALENLQTLCWRCNRSKSNKLPSNDYS